MAHTNMLERRARIAQLLSEGVTVRAKLARDLADEFGCTVYTVMADAANMDQGFSMRRQGMDFSEIYKRDKGRCQYCLKSVNKLKAVAEHVIPRHHGGPSEPHNLVVACQVCNALKGRTVWIPANLDEITKDIPEWKTRVILYTDPRLGKAEIRSVLG